MREEESEYKLDKKSKVLELEIKQSKIQKCINEENIESIKCLRWCLESYTIDESKSSIGSEPSFMLTFTDDQRDLIVKKLMDKINKL